MSASPSQLTVSGDPSSAFNPSTSTTDPFSGTPYAAATAPAVGGPVSSATTSPTSPTNPRKRRASHQQLAPNAATIAPSSVVAGGGTSAGTASAYTTDHHASAMGGAVVAAEGGGGNEPQQPVQPPPPKKGRTNTPWTAAEEQRLKIMRDAGNSWSEIAKTFPTRTEGSVKKHWYKDMHYAEFAEDESAALLAAIKEYEASKWKVIGAKVGKPAKACEQYAKEHFGGKY